MTWELVGADKIRHWIQQVGLVHTFQVTHIWPMNWTHINKKHNINTHTHLPERSVTWTKVSLKLAKMWHTPNTSSPSGTWGPRATFSSCWAVFLRRAICTQGVQWPLYFFNQPHAYKSNQHCKRLSRRLGIHTDLNKHSSPLTAHSNNHFPTSNRLGLVEGHRMPSHYRRKHHYK